MYDVRDTQKDWKEEEEGERKKERKNFPENDDDDVDSDVDDDTEMMMRMMRVGPRPTLSLSPSLFPPVFFFFSLSLFLLGFLL